MTIGQVSAFRNEILAALPDNDINALPGVPPAPLRFHTVAYCTQCRSRPLRSVRNGRRSRFNAELGALHAMSTPG